MRNIIVLLLMLVPSLTIYSQTTTRSSNTFKLTGMKFKSVDIDNASLTFDVGVRVGNMAGREVDFALISVNNEGRYYADRDGDPLCEIVTKQMSKTVTEGKVTLSIPESVLPISGNEDLYILCMALCDGGETVLDETGPLAISPKVLENMMQKEMVGSILDVLFGGGDSGSSGGGTSECTLCYGSGKCSYCDGRSYSAGNDIDCSRCNNSGKCWRCNGSGRH